MREKKRKEKKGKERKGKERKQVEIELGPKFWILQQ
jgi:hypothetical protein